MRTKLLILVAGYFLLDIILVSCGPCNDVKYYDFHTLQFIAVNPTVSTIDSLHFWIDRKDNTYMASGEYPGVISNAAYAQDCDDGWGGMKYGVVKIEITSDRDFNEDYPANALLNDLITVNAGLVQMNIHFKNFPRSI